MANRYVVGIDAGTSSVRGVVFDIAGQLISEYCEVCNYESPPHVAPMGREFDPEALWGAVCRVVRNAIKNSQIQQSNIAAVSATAQRQGMVFLDREGKEIYAGPNIDLRSIAEGMSMDYKWGGQIHAITGHSPSLMFAPARLKWFENNRPDIFERIQSILTIGDWITYRLCGEMVTELSAASELGLIDVQRVSWSGQLQELLGLPHDIYPELSMAGSMVGKVSVRAAMDTGLPEGTPVALGGPDTQCGLLGMGVKGNGDCGIVAGWSAPLQIVTDEAVLSSEARTWTSCHVLPQKWILESNIGEAGNIYGWFKDILLEGGSFEFMDQLAQEVPPGADGTIALLAPATVDMSSPGVRFGGVFFPLPPTTMGIGKAQLTRAVLENICFAFNDNHKQIEGISNSKIEEIRVGGGLSKSKCFCEILAAVLAVPTAVSQTSQASALGAAICAATGSGFYQSLDEAAEAMQPGFTVIKPDSASVLEYAEHYERWRKTARWMENLVKEIE